MGKTSNYERRPKDKYFTPEKAVLPLVPHLPPEFTFCEPCAGNGQLVAHLEKHFDATCFLAMDIEPEADWILEGDSSLLSDDDVEVCNYIITNPPFKWEMLVPLLDRWLPLRRTILLLPADFMHNIRFAPYLRYCSRIVSIGRVKWFEDSKTSGVENYAWFFFDIEDPNPTTFYGRLK